MKASPLRCTPPAFPGNNLKPFPVRSQENWLQNAAL
jgi:hypothetical protein